MINQIKEIKGYEGKYNYLKEKSILFQEVASIEDAKKSHSSNSKILIGTFSYLSFFAGLNPIPGVDSVLVSGYMTSIFLGTNSIYGYEMKDISKQDIINAMKGKKYTPIESSENEERNLLKAQIYFNFRKFRKSWFLLFF